MSPLGVSILVYGPMGKVPEKRGLTMVPHGVVRDRLVRYAPERGQTDTGTLHIVGWSSTG